MSNLMSNYSPLDVTFTNGSGCWLTDSEGRQYFDALSGIGVVNLGHCHPAITQSIIEQSRELLHTSNVYRIENQERLAERLEENPNDLNGWRRLLRAYRVLGEKEKAQMVLKRIKKLENK